MKTKLTMLLCGVVVLCAAMGAVTVGVASFESPTAAPEVTIEAPQPPVVVMPAGNFDLEVASPADLGDQSDNSIAEAVEAPAPELTWYDPHRLEEIGGLS